MIGQRAIRFQPLASLTANDVIAETAVAALQPGDRAVHLLEREPSAPGHKTGLMHRSEEHPSR